uniref:Uncharacterized protein n=1 Tax=Arundo donax TaxID=35708 RepID=A0A0A8ZL46_ARUDO
MLSLLTYLTLFHKGLHNTFHTMPIKILFKALISNLHSRVPPNSRSMTSSNNFCLKRRVTTHPKLLLLIDQPIV